MVQAATPSALESRNARGGDPEPPPPPLGFRAAEEEEEGGGGIAPPGIAPRFRVTSITHSSESPSSGGGGSRFRIA